MELCLRVLSFGLLPAVWLSGMALLRFATRRRRLAIGRLSVLCLAPALSLPAWSLALTLSAKLGVYRAEGWGALGWIACLPLSVWLRRQPALGCRERRWLEIALAATCLGAVALYASHAHESFFAGRDQGTYSNQALHLALFGEADLPYPVELEENGLVHVAGHGYAATGLHRAPGKLIVQFSPVFPLWLATFFSAFGLWGLLSTNAALSGLAIGVFYALARKLLARPWALSATAFFAVEPLQIWISRISLSEVLAQYLALSGLLLACAGQRSREAGLAGFAGCVLGAVVFARIDGFVMAPLAIALGLSLAVFGRREPGARDAAQTSWFFAAWLATLALGVLLYLGTSWTYMQSLSDNLYPLLWLSLGLGVVWLATRRWLWGSLRGVLGRREAWGALLVALLAVSAYAYFVRPYRAPFSHYDSPGWGLHGQRDYRENSLLALGVYLTPGVAFAGVVGFFVVLRHTLGRPRAWGRLALLVVWAGYSALYLYNPSISSDHPWGFRRFVPVTIPGFILFAFAAVAWAFRSRLLRRARHGAAAVAALGLMAHSFVVSRAYLFEDEFRGAFAHLTEVMNSIPRESLLLCDLTSRVFIHAALGRARRALRFDLAVPERFEAAQQVVEENVAPGETYYLLVDDERPLIGHSPLRAFSYEPTWLSGTTFPPAREMRKARFGSLLYALEGPLEPASRELAGLGVRPIEGVSEGGFWETERDATGRETRWTRDVSRLSLPLTRGLDPRRLVLEIAEVHPEGTDLAVTVNGREALVEHVDAAPRSIAVDLPAELGTTLKLRFEVRGFRPSELETSEDARWLGMRVRSLALE